MTRYYHTGSDRGDQFEAQHGGYYERIEDDGCPQLQYAGGGPIGFPTAERPAVSGSKSPEASLFAAIFNEQSPNEYHIYATTKPPDADISDCPYDFAINEEVRWFYPEDDPIPFEIYERVLVPQKAVNDVMACYEGMPHDPNRSLAQDVKAALRTLIDGGDYPPNVVEEWDNPYEDY